MSDHARSDRNLRERIEALPADPSFSEVMELVRDTFRVHFGITSDESRMHDVANEFHEFTRALTRQHRLDEYGDLLSSLFAFAAEQHADPAQAIKNTLLKIERRADIYAEHGDKPNVAIFGGSFDPPHLGHLAAAQAILASTLDIREVWLMPSFSAMSCKRLTEAKHRAAMCRLFEELDPRIRFFGYEIDHKLSSETRQTILRLMQEDFADRYRMHFVVSVDVANSIPGWPGSDELVRSVPFITLPRPGFAPDLRHPWFLQTPHRYLSEARGLIEVSSSDIRQAYRSKDMTRAAALLPSPVETYIREHGLYTIP